MVVAGQMLVNDLVTIFFLSAVTVALAVTVLTQFAGPRAPPNSTCIVTVALGLFELSPSILFPRSPVYL